MTLKQLVEHIRRQRLDDFPTNTSQNWETDDEGLLWSNGDIVDYINQAMREYCSRRPLLDSTTAAICQYAISPGTHVKTALDYRIVMVNSAKLASQDEALVKTYQRYLDDRWTDWRKETAIPKYYLENFDEESLMLIGVIAAADTLNLTVGRMPLADVVWPLQAWAASATLVVDDLTYPTSANLNEHYYKVTAITTGITAASEPTWPIDGSTVVDGGVTWTDQGVIGASAIPEIPVRHHHDLIEWVCHLAYLKHDVDSFDKNASDHHYKLFEMRVGPRIDTQREVTRRQMANLRPRNRTHYK